MTQYTLLDALRDEQNTLLTLMGQARAALLPEAALLEWALTQTVTAYRQFKAGEITWTDAARAFQDASDVQMQCDNALFEFNHADNPRWQAAKIATTFEAVLP